MLGTLIGPFIYLGSAYLGIVVPDTDAVHNILGVALLREGRYADVLRFRRHLRPFARALIERASEAAA